MRLGESYFRLFRNHPFKTIIAAILLTREPWIQLLPDNSSIHSHFDVVLRYPVLAIGLLH